MRFVKSQLAVKASQELERAVAGDLCTEDEMNPKNIDLIGAAITQARPLNLSPSTDDPKGPESDGDVSEDYYGDNMEEIK